MSHWQEDAAWGTFNSAGQWTPSPLLRAANRIQVLLVIQLSLACTQFGLLTLPESLLSWDCVTPDLVFLPFWCCYGLLCPRCEARAHRALLFSFSLELAHLSRSKYWHMSKCRLANLEGHWSHLCQGVKDAAVTRRNSVHGSACALFYHPSGKLQNFYLYLFSKEVFQVHLAKVMLLFFILTALLR